MSCGAETVKWQRALVTCSAELAQPHSCLLPLLLHVRDCVSAGSDVRMVYFEVFPKHARTWGMFRGTGGGLLGGSPGEFTKIPLPVVPLGAHRNSQPCPGPRRCLLHLNLSQE